MFTCVIAVSNDLTPVYCDLSNFEMSTILDGGSSLVVAFSPEGEQYDAYLDIDGLWLKGNEPGYVFDVTGWRIERAY